MLVLLSLLEVMLLLLMLILRHHGGLMVLLLLLLLVLLLLKHVHVAAIVHGELLLGWRPEEVRMLVVLRLLCHRGCCTVMMVGQHDGELLMMILGRSRVVPQLFSTRLGVRGDDAALLVVTVGSRLGAQGLEGCGTAASGGDDDDGDGNDDGGSGNGSLCG